MAPSGGEYPDSRLTNGEMSTSPVDSRSARHGPLVDGLSDGVLVGGTPVDGALPPDDERLTVHGPAGRDGLSPWLRR